jgi:hypothetical protein
VSWSYSYRFVQGTDQFSAPGDRSHIPEHARPIFDVLTEHLNQMKQVTPPQQRRVVDDSERRIDSLFDSLNCETLPDSAVEQLLALVKGEFPILFTLEAAS